MLSVQPGDVFCKVPHDLTGRCLLVELRTGGQLIEWQAQDPASRWSGQWCLDEGHLVIDIGPYSMRTDSLTGSTPVVEGHETGPNGRTPFLVAKVLASPQRPLARGASLIVTRPGRLPVCCELGRRHRAVVRSPAGPVPDEDVRWDDGDVFSLTLEQGRIELNLAMSHGVPVLVAGGMHGVGAPQVVAVAVDGDRSRPSVGAVSSPGVAKVSPDRARVTASDRDPVRRARAVELVQRFPTAAGIATELVGLQLAAAEKERSGSAAVDPAMRQALVGQMEERLNDVATRAVLDAMADDELTHFERLIDGDATPAEVEAFLSRAVPERGPVAAEALVRFVERQLPAT